LTDPDWRTGHCAEPAAEAVRRATGRDILAELGGCPRSPRQAATLYRRLGVTCLRDAVSAVLGTSIDPKRAMRGDIAMVDGSLGIVLGEWVECFDRMQPIERATHAWHVEKG
jgi:hypothetical protein